MKRLAAPLMRPVVAREVDFVADSDLAGHYRFGIPAAEMATMHPKLKRILSMEQASKPEILKFRNRNHVIKWGDTVEDTGKSEVQIACMTQRIKFLSEHLTTHRKDQHSAMGLKRLVGRRRRLMKYLKRKSVARYYKLIADLELRDL
jgi:small subunit ribosomal protein S15